MSHELLSSKAQEQQPRRHRPDCCIRRTSSADSAAKTRSAIRAGCHPRQGRVFLCADLRTVRLDRSLWADEIAAEPGFLCGASVEGAGWRGPTTLMGPSIGLLARLIRLDCGDDCLQGSQMPSQGGASWLGQRDLAART